MKNDMEVKPEPQATTEFSPAGGQPAPAETTAAASPEGFDVAAAYKKSLAEKEELQDRLLRKQAELENLRKRMQKEKEDLVQYANAELIRSLLPTLDGFDRALQHRDAGVAPQFYEGLELIYRQIMDVLGRAGLVPLETKGATFDPHLHQAVETVESAAHRDHEIVEELQRGYKLKHRLLRPAIVKVAVEKGRSAQSSGGDPPSSE